MISITVEEKKQIRLAHPNVPIVRTMRQRSKRHRYYMVEQPAAMELLKLIRKTRSIEVFELPKTKKRGGKHGKHA